MIRATENRVSGEEYERLALLDRGERLELWDGVLVEKPDVSVEHGDIPIRFVLMLGNQLDPAAFRLRAGHARVRWSRSSYFVPDIAVVPTERVLRLKESPGALDLYADPLPLVVEIWSPSTPRYDLDAKIPAYRERGDMEIWRVHPHERRVTAWRRQPDGAYAEFVFLGGIVEIPSLPGTHIDLDALFAD